MFESIPAYLPASFMSRFYILILVTLSFFYFGCARYSHLQKGQTLYNQGRYSEAITEWEKVSPRDKNYLQAQLKISEVKRTLQERNLLAKKKTLIERALRSAETFFRNKEYAKARTLWKKVLRLDPNNVIARERLKDIDFIVNSGDRVFYNRGVALYKQGLLNAARQEFEKAQKINPDNPKTVQYLDVISKVGYLSYTSKKGDTLPKIARSYTGNADDAKILADFNNLNGLSKIKSGEVVKVPLIKGFKTSVLKGKPDSTPEDLPLEDPGEKPSFQTKEMASMVDDGIMLYTEGEYKKALDIFEKVLIKDPKNYEADRYASLIRETLKEAESRKEVRNEKEPESQKDVEHQKEPKNQKVTENVRIVENQEETKNQREPDNPREYDVLKELEDLKEVEKPEGPKSEKESESQKELGNPQGSGSQKELENQKEPESLKELDIQDDVKKILEKGLSYKERQAYTEAIAEFEKALNLDPNNAQAQTYLEETKTTLQKQVALHLNEGIRYFNDQQLEKAIAEWDKVLALSPDNQKAKDYRKRAHTMLEKLRTLKNSSDQPQQ
jgi:tetratricopeptide (TPR) repeat protein